MCRLFAFSMAFMSKGLNLYCFKSREYLDCTLDGHLNITSSSVLCNLFYDVVFQYDQPLFFEIR
ncbi:hypothetical protein BS50DRAFT_578189 [Corynespora cassiicola Philippines]|uniref:Uncharacterized protein n=1 Tax=Corynespora cassiicola Philippines TaxID=1448308 RepID=A0A2T2N875_CORCC|nr:hypothetical protein BS50DRAFT_578189 [Corynespora cassiicola Philippines]